MSLVIILAGFVERRGSPEAWKADPVAAIVIALILLGEGGRTFAKEGTKLGIWGARPHDRGEVLVENIIVPGNVDLPVRVGRASGT